MPGRRLCAPKRTGPSDLGWAVPNVAIDRTEGPPHIAAPSRHRRHGTLEPADSRVDTVDDGMTRAASGRSRILNAPGILVMKPLSR
jgi:hypothetical protein